MYFQLVKSDSDYVAIVSHTFKNTTCLGLLVYIVFEKSRDFR